MWNIKSVELVVFWALLAEYTRLKGCCIVSWQYIGDVAFHSQVREGPAVDLDDHDIPSCWSVFALFHFIKPHCLMWLPRTKFLHLRLLPATVSSPTHFITSLPMSLLGSESATHCPPSSRICGGITTCPKGGPWTKDRPAPLTWPAKEQTSTCVVCCSTIFLNCGEVLPETIGTTQGNRQGDIFPPTCCQ